MSERATHCYVAAHPGKAGYYAACVDDPKYAKETAKFVAKCIREGAIIDRVTMDETRRGLNEYVRPTQLPLLKK